MGAKAFAESGLRGCWDSRGGRLVDELLDNLNSRGVQLVQPLPTQEQLERPVIVLEIVRCAQGMLYMEVGGVNPGSLFSSNDLFRAYGYHSFC